MQTPDITELTTKPATYFSSPMEIVENKLLHASAKLKALKEWEFEVRQLEVATEENMCAHASTTLQDVHAAMRALGHEPHLDTTPGGKAG